MCVVTGSSVPQSAVTRPELQISRGLETPSKGMEQWYRYALGRRPRVDSGCGPGLRLT